MPRGYTLVEPDIYQALNWDADLITKSLEVIRQSFTSIIPESTIGVKCDLLAVTSPHNLLPGPHYPAIGIHCADQAAEAAIDKLDISNVETRFEVWIQALGIDTLKARAIQVASIDWNMLKDLGAYPIR